MVVETRRRRRRPLQPIATAGSPARPTPARRGAVARRATALARRPRPPHTVVAPPLRAHGARRRRCPSSARTCSRNLADATSDVNDVADVHDGARPRSSRAARPRSDAGPGRDRRTLSTPCCAGSPPRSTRPGGELSSRRLGTPDVSVGWTEARRLGDQRPGPPDAVHRRRDHRHRGRRRRDHLHPCAAAKTTPEELAPRRPPSGRDHGRDRRRGRPFGGPAPGRSRRRHRGGARRPCAGGASSSPFSSAPSVACRPPRRRRACAGSLLVVVGRAPRPGVSPSPSRRRSAATRGGVPLASLDPDPEASSATRSSSTRPRTRPSGHRGGAGRRPPWWSSTRRDRPRSGRGRSVSSRPCGPPPSGA